MTQSVPQFTLAEFDVWALQPENVSTEYEYICGEVVLREVSDYRAAVIATHLTTQLFMHVQQHKFGYVLGGRSGFCIGDERYVPIATYTNHSRWIQIDETCYLPFAPTLAIESVSSLRHPKHLRRKITNYLRHHTIVWLIHAEDQEIEVYNPEQPVRVLNINDTLQGEELLPDFSVAVKDIFEAARETPEEDETDA
jgi:Uma2 family endonuclease